MRKPKETWIKRWFVFNSLRLLRIRGQNEKVARGFALGLIINFVPTFGFGVLISGFFARLLGGNVVAGLVGGATLTFVWPLLFYLNLKVGGLFFSPPIPIDDPDDVTSQNLDILVQGNAFFVGAVLNALMAGLGSYILFLTAFERVRSRALLSFRSRLWRGGRGALAVVPISAASGGTGNRLR